MKKISIIIPCLNEEEALPVYYEKMSAVMDGMADVEFELLFVDDGSTDGTTNAAAFFPFPEILGKRRRSMRG